MTVDDYVAEGDSYRLAHPSASPKRVRTYLENLTSSTSSDVRREAGNAAAWGGAEGCVGALVVLPLVALYNLATAGRDRRRIDRAMEVLFPGGADAR